MWDFLKTLRIYKHKTGIHGTYTFPMGVNMPLKNPSDLCPPVIPWFLAPASTSAASSTRNCQRYYREKYTLNRFITKFHANKSIKLLFNFFFLTEVQILSYANSIEADFWLSTGRLLVGSDNFWILVGYISGRISALGVAGFHLVLRYCWGFVSEFDVHSSRLFILFIFLWV